MQINTLRLRAMLGWLGMLLPWMCLGLSLVFGYGVPDSISATYYLAPTITPFMIILGSAAFLLISYKGYDKQDDIVCTLSGIMALGICLFPCSNSDMYNAGYISDFVGTFQIPYQVSGWIHNISAVFFFLLLAYNSFFLFTKSGGEMTPNKKKRNIIFRVCGVGMAISFVAIIPISILEIWGGTWAVEAIALAFFGISWLTKSDIYPWLFCDTPYVDEVEQ